ncbi:MAG: Gfo/Idh/MocA family oxidoreductase [Spirochaetes bacterium]|nr:Gfo/Idh/MocA family oxidoreductase [Spirochaetota bacterium]
MSKSFKVAMIGLDTSHTIEFTKLIQGEAPAGQKVEGLEVVSCLRFPTPFQNEEGQDTRQKQMEAWGVKVTRDLSQALEGVDGLLLEINDPAFHLGYFEKVAALGKPIFLDKPMASNMTEARAIEALVKKHGVRVWSSSSLRFLKSLQGLLAQIPAAERKYANVYGPLGQAPAGSSVTWYGVHTVEMLVAIMGVGARAVSAHQADSGITATIVYDHGRRGVVELTNQLWLYGGRIIDGKGARSFTHENETLYFNLLGQIADFFLKGALPVPLSETLEVQAILGAIDASLAAKGEVKVDR